MLEFMLCSLVTILPDYLYRRYGQGKRIGHEIDLFSMWYELRWGITLCLMLTLTLITIVFFYHPSTTNVTSVFRTLTILSEDVGRVEEVFVESGQHVEAGDLLFTLDDSEELAAVETAQQRVAEVDAEIVVAESELKAALGEIDQRLGLFEQAQDELQRQVDLQQRNPGATTQQRIDALQSEADSRQGALDVAIAQKEVVEARIDVELPAKRLRAEDELHQAEAQLKKMEVFAEVSGTIEQFALQPGDIVNPVLRPAGILIPDRTVVRFQAGFGQIAISVIKVGMLAEITCAAKPFIVIPMVVVDVQDVVAAGQIRPTDRLLDLTDLTSNATFMAVLEPLYEGTTDGIPPGSRCIANAYTNNHELLQSGDLSTASFLFLHVVDTLGLLHAVILRLQALILPINILVLSGH